MNQSELDYFRQLLMQLWLDGYKFQWKNHYPSFREFCQAVEKLGEQS